MKQPDATLNVGLRRVLAQQALIAAATIAGFALFKDPAAALPSAFGAAGAVMMTTLLALRIKRLNRRLEQNKAVSTGTVMLGFAPRLLLVLILFWLGISILDLAPLPMVIAFALVHLGYLLNIHKTENVKLKP